MMKGLPLPKERLGWLLGLVLIFLFFEAYYASPGFLYEKLENAYYENFYRGDPVKDEKITSLQMEVRLPQYIASLVEREVLVTFRNVTSQELTDINFIIVGQTVEEPKENIALITKTLPSDEATADASVISIEVIPPYSTITRSIWIKVPPGQKGEVQMQFHLMMEGIDTASPVFIDGQTVVEINSSKTITQSFVQALLLPPWSNGLLPILALFWAWYGEQIFDNKKNIDRWKGGRSDKRIIFRLFLFGSVAGWLILGCFIPYVLTWVAIRAMNDIRLVFIPFSALVFILVISSFLPRDGQDIK
jgi:hypothetical protein